MKFIIKYLSKNALLIFLLVSFVFYLVYVFYIHPPWQWLPMDGYIGRAVDMANGGSFGKGDTFFPVGTSYLLAPFFYFFNYDLALRIIAIFYVFLLTVTNYLVFRIVLDFYKSKTGAWFALVFCSVYYPLFAYVGFYISETPFTFLLVLSLFLFCRTFYSKKSYLSSALLTGVIMGFASIVRGTLLISFVLFVMILITKLFLTKYCKKTDYYKKIIFFIVGFLLVIAMQSVRNSVILGKFTLFSTNGGINMYLGQSHTRIVKGDSAHGDWYWFDPNYFWNKTLTKEEVFSVDYWQEDIFYNKVKGLWKEDPTRQIKRSFGNGIELFYLVKPWITFGNVTAEKLSFYFQYVFIFLIYFPLVVALFLSFKNKKNRFLNLIFVMPILGLILMAMATKGEERYLAPFKYLMIILAAPFWAELLSRIIAKKNKFKS